jgi:hypothetical protein
MRAVTLREDAMPTLFSTVNIAYQHTLAIMHPEEAWIRDETQIPEYPGSRLSCLNETQAKGPVSKKSYTRTHSRGDENPLTWQVAIDMPVAIQLPMTTFNQCRYHFAR